MRDHIYVDHASMQGMSATLGGLAVGSPIADFDMSPMRSDLVTSAARVFSDGWEDAVTWFEHAAQGLSIGVDDTAKDFLSAEQAHVVALAGFVDALDE